MIDSTKIEVLRKEVRQCVTELEAAAKIVRGQGLPSLVTIYEAAAKRARENLELPR